MIDDISKSTNAKNIDILVGTQMISKGHDYHDVGLSIIMGVDNILQIPDFRSRQKAMSVVIQVAGRSGRKNQGRVIVQTLNEGFFKNYLEYEKFLKDELKYRKDLYPPFKRVALVQFSHKKSEIAKKSMQQMVKNLKKFKNIEIIGYGPAPIEKIAAKFRFNILLRSDSAKALISAITASRTDFSEVDMDPVSII